MLLSKRIPSLLSFEAKQKDGSSSTGFSSFSNFKNIYITGHSNGAINFWDASSPLMVPILSLNQQVNFYIYQMFSMKKMDGTLIHELIWTKISQMNTK